MRLRDADTKELVREVSIKSAGSQVVAEACLCERRKTARAQLAQIPPMFNKPKLSRLRPRVDLHYKQAAVIDFVKAHPGDSYLLLGRNGTGKSHLAWAMFRAAAAAKRSVVAYTVSDLHEAFRRMDLSMKDGDLWLPRVTANDLRRPGKPWFLLLEEFEKARPSEFASEHLFKLLDAAKSFNHQIVVTSNMRAEQLRDHWARTDEVYGNSIMTRLESCHVVEMF